MTRFRGSSKCSPTNLSACSECVVAIRPISRARPFPCWPTASRPKASRCNMGKTTGFMDYSRELAPRRPVAERVNDWFEIYQDFPEEKLRKQGARCMDCGVPFCQTGCPVSNLIPDWNDLVYRGRWKDAVRQLHATNNFPEFTGRICPAPCEVSCVLGINVAAVGV